jgi:hypothetical protein
LEQNRFIVTESRSKGKKYRIEIAPEDGDVHVDVEASGKLPGKWCIAHHSPTEAIGRRVALPERLLDLWRGCSII